MLCRPAGSWAFGLQAAIEAGALRDCWRLSAVTELDSMGAGFTIRGDLDGVEQSHFADEIIACTGARPDLEMLRELRLDLDPAVEATRALAPLIDPNLHSCGTVRPHGEAELRQPEPGFYIAGMKSYGRAPTFLVATGYEQVRSIAAALSGDWAAARDVQLNLPETGVCVTEFADGGVCCAPEDAAQPALLSLGAIPVLSGESIALQAQAARCC